MDSLAVIASILIAFAIDRAWDNHQERAERLELLTGLRAEIVEDQALADSAQAQTRQAAQWLQHVYGSSPEEVAKIPPADTYRQVYLPYVRGWDVALSTGYLEATINSGKLALIPGADTRAALTRVQTANGYEARVNAQLDELGAQAATVLGEMDGVLRANNGSRASNAPPVFDPAALRAIRENTRLQGLASARLLFYGGFMYRIAVDVKPALDNALKLIDRDLASLR